MASEASARGWVVPVLGLLVATFAICTAELVIAGLLPAIAADMRVDIPTAGLLISGYALGVAIASPVLALVTGGVSRRLLIIVVVVVFMTGNIGCAVATNYGMLLAARLLMAACHGLFFGVAMVIASRVAPPARQSTAVSLVLAGVTAATVAGIPLGTAIGNALGWRTTFWIIAGAAGLAAAVLLLVIPSDEPRKGHETAAVTLGAELRAAARPAVLICFANTALLMTGVFAYYAYIVPILTQASGISLEVVPWILAATGVACVVGNLVGGRLGDLNPTATMIGSLAGSAVLGALVTMVVANGILAATIMCGLSFLFFLYPAPLQGRVLKETADAPNFASTLTQTAFQWGIASGAAVGGAAIASGWSYGQLPWISSGFFLLALLGTFGLAFYDRRRKAALA